RVRDPSFFPVTRHVEALRAVADRTHRLVPLDARTARTGPAALAAGALGEGHGSGADVRRYDATAVSRDDEHVRPILTGTEHQIDLLCRRIVAAHGLRPFAG